MRRRLMLTTIAGLVLALLVPSVAGAASGGGAVFTLSNNPQGNRVLAWHRDADGNLTSAGGAATGGRGSGAGVGSQGALALTPNHRWLYAVNPGSDEISV